MCSLIFSLISPISIIILIDNFFSNEFSSRSEDIKENFPIEKFIDKFLISY
jgi:purine-cytosine permease-like protein